MIKTGKTMEELFTVNNKLSVEEIAELWRIWEAVAGESFIDYFLDDAVNNVGFVVGYFVGKFPELGQYILQTTNYTIPWRFIQDNPYVERTKDFIPSLLGIVENFYGVYDLDGNSWNPEAYDKSVFVWSSLIHDVDSYYKDYCDWMSNECYHNEDIIKEFNEWKTK